VITALVVIVIIQLLALRERRLKARDAESDEVDCNDEENGSVRQRDKKVSLVGTEEMMGVKEESIGL
jgi:hypothetical protein